MTLRKTSAAVTEHSIYFFFTKIWIHFSSLIRAFSCLCSSRSHYQCDYWRQCTYFCHRFCTHCHSVHPGGRSLFCGLHRRCTALLYFHRTGKWGHLQIFFLSLSLTFFPPSLSSSLSPFFLFFPNFLPLFFFFYKILCGILY